MYLFWNHARIAIWLAKKWLQPKSHSTFLEFSNWIYHIDPQSSFCKWCYATAALDESDGVCHLQFGSFRFTSSVLDFKMNIIKKKLHFFSCNFCLKSNLCLQIAPPLRGRGILLLCVWFNLTPNCTLLSGITIIVIFILKSMLFSAIWWVPRRAILAPVQWRI